MALDIVSFPDPLVPVIRFLSEHVADASAELPDRFQRHLLVNCVTRPATMVTRETVYTIEGRDRAGDGQAAEMTSLAASVLEAWARTDDGPLSAEINSIVDSFPDPDDGCPRSVLVCSLIWRSIVPA